MRALSLGAHSSLPLSRLRPVNSRRRCTRVRHQYKLKCKKGAPNKRRLNCSAKYVVSTHYIRNTNARRQFVCRTWMKRDCTTQRTTTKYRITDTCMYGIFFSFRSNSSLETKSIINHITNYSLSTSSGKKMECVPERLS